MQVSHVTFEAIENNIGNKPIDQIIRSALLT